MGLITNATTRLDEHLDKLRLTTEFDHVFNSSEMGFAKPDVQIFELACDRLGLTPSDVVFVDDSPSHVEAAASVGINSSCPSPSSGDRSRRPRRVGAAARPPHPNRERPRRRCRKWYWQPCAGEVVDLVLRYRREATVTRLDDAAPWGKPVDDERYLVVSRG